MYHSDHPVCAASEASRLFITGAATLLFQEGNTLSRQFVHILYDRRYSENIYWWNRPTMIAFPRMCPSIALKAAMRVFAASCGVAAGTSSFISNA